MENSNFHNTEIIEVPQEFHPTCDYDSHRPFLWLAIQLDKNYKAFYEFGCGLGSTPLLRRYCNGFKKELFSYETNLTWFESIGNGTQLLKNYMNVELESAETQGCIFIDSAPGEQRKDLILKHANNADLIIVHDTEQGAEYVYMMRDTLNSFKYRIDLDIPGAPSTTIVSNFIDLNYLKGKKILDYFIK